MTLLGEGAIGETAIGEITSGSASPEILATSVGSAEAFGVAIVASDVAIIGVGDIASAEAFGTPSTYRQIRYEPISRCDV